MTTQSVSLPIVVAALLALERSAEAIVEAIDDLKDQIEDAGEEVAPLVDVIEKAWQDLSDMFRRDPVTMRGRAAAARRDGDLDRAERIERRARKVERRSAKRRTRRSS